MRRLGLYLYGAPDDLAAQIAGLAQPLDFDVRSTGDAARMNEWIAADPPGAVLLYWTARGLPERRALLGVKRLAGIRVPCFALLAEKSRHLANECQALGADAFLFAPVEPGDFYSKLARFADIKGLAGFIQDKQLLAARRILLLNSRPWDDEAFSLFLREHGYQLTVASDLREGLTLLLRERFHLVIVDRRFGDRDGVYLAKTLNRQPSLRGVPLFLLADRFTREDLPAVKEAGVFDVIVRPFEWQSVLAKVNRVLFSRDVETALAECRQAAACETKTVRKTVRRNNAMLIDGRTGRVDIEKLGDAVTDLGALPVTVSRVMRVVSDPDAAARDLADALETDQALAGKVLKYANSCFYARRHTVATVDDAVITLGFRTVRSLAVGFKVMKFFVSTGGKAEFFDRVAFWHHSLAVGVLARLLAARAGYDDPDVAFVAGLLHDVGKAVFDEHLPRFLDDAQTKAVAQRCSLREAERDCIGLAHTDLGPILVDRWKLPHRIGAAISSHHASFERLTSPEALGRAHGRRVTTSHAGGDSVADRALAEWRLVGLVALANRLAKGVDVGFGGDNFLGVVPARAAANLDLTDLDWPPFLAEFRAAYRELLDLLVEPGAGASRAAAAAAAEEDRRGRRTRLTVRGRGLAAVVLKSAPPSWSLGGLFLRSVGYEVREIAVSSREWRQRLLMSPRRDLVLVELDTAGELRAVLGELRPDPAHGCDEAPLLVAIDDYEADPCAPAEFWAPLVKPYDGAALLSLIEKVRAPAAGAAG
ncbi:MAG: HDOD domain-containing protein [Planctomycetes bacterium]|nr:HDOD domain-containing protein [Planctomycetota bacterium]